MERRWLDPRLIERYDALLQAHEVGLRLCADVGGRGERLFLGALTTGEKSTFDGLVPFVFVPLDAQDFAERRRAHVRWVGLWWVWMLWLVGPGSLCTVAVLYWLWPKRVDDMHVGLPYLFGLFICHVAAACGVALSSLTGARRLPEFWALLGYLTIAGAVGLSLLVPFDEPPAPAPAVVVVLVLALGALVPIIGFVRLWSVIQRCRTSDPVIAALRAGLAAGAGTALAWCLAFAVLDACFPGGACAMQMPCAAPALGFLIALNVCTTRLERLRRRAALHPPPPPVASPPP
ncbi:MAG: hypothetical protein IPK26_17125 [Planctomycetes bacterium]|nr:hypothetical protein [Planctomycetota bacterium]